VRLYVGATLGLMLLCGGLAALVAPGALRLPVAPPALVAPGGLGPGAAEAPEGFPPETQAALEREWQALQAALAALVRGARRVVATESGHYVQLQQPGLVTAAIREVVEAARRAPPATVRGLPRTGGGFVPAAPERLAAR
jgi:hypothetical protein